ncbi:MAG: DMT family transporter [Armatimonadota bacterium]|nr:MAG: DMT family transporter [Armatimonadota bacterium]
MTPHLRYRLFLVAAGVLWSTSGVILKSLPGVHWLAIAGMRSLFATIIFLPGLTRRAPSAKLVAAVLIYAVLVSALMGSMQLGTAAQGIWLQYIAPAVVALWAWLLQRQRLRPVEVAAVLLTLLAVALIVTGGSGPAHRESVLLGVVSGLAFGSFIILLKSLKEVAPATIFSWTNLGTAVIVLPIALSCGVSLPTDPRALLLLAAMGIGQLGLAYYFFQWGLARTRAVEASLIVLLEPILNPIWVYLALGEVPPLRVIIGCGMIALGLVAFALGPGARAGADGRRD